MISSKLDPLAPLLSDPVMEGSLELVRDGLLSEFLVGLYGVDSLFGSYWSFDGVSFWYSSKSWKGP